MILVCGEALIDLFVDPPEGTEMPARAVAGGSPFNVAIGLARLGAAAGFFGGVSRDRFGTLLADILGREGVDTRFLVRTDRLTTLSAIATAADGQPSYSFHGAAAADRSLTAGDLPAQLPDTVRALTFGSYTIAALLGPAAPEMMSVFMLRTFGDLMRPEEAEVQAVVAFLVCAALGTIYVRLIAEEKR